MNAMTASAVYIRTMALPFCASSQPRPGSCSRYDTPAGSAFEFGLPRQPLGFDLLQLAAQIRLVGEQRLDRLPFSIGSWIGKPCFDVGDLAAKPLHVFLQALDAAL